MSEFFCRMQIPSDRPGAIPMKFSTLCSVTALSFTVLGLASASAAQQAQHVDAKNPSQTSIAAGQQTFNATCASCHGLDGRGGERAPDIATRPEITRLSDADLLKVLRAGIPEKGMPPFIALGNAKLSALLSYVRTLQGKGLAIQLVGNAEKGKELYWNKAGCSNCHMMNGAGGFLGRDLSNYGETHSFNEIRSAIVEPQKNSGSRGRAAEVTTKDGKVYSGVVRNEDNFSLQLQSVDGAFYLFSKVDITQFNDRKESLMPSDYGSKLSASELDALAAYIVGLAHGKQKREDKFLE